MTDAFYSVPCFIDRKEALFVPREFDLICIGTALVDSIIRGFDPTPVSASGYRAEAGTLSAGGEAVNAAMAAAKLGVRAAILCALGDDAAGQLVTAALASCGVEAGLIVREAGHPTPVTTMFVNPDGTRKSITNGSHRHNFHPERFCENLPGAGMLLLGSLFRAPFDDPAVVSAVLQYAAGRGIPVIADTKLPNFRFLTLDDLADALPLIDTVTPNEDEARYYSGRDEPEAMADVFLAYGVKHVVIKLGARGCLYKSAERCLRLPAFDVAARDATGAGDNFAAGLAAERLRGADWETALRFASACGALCATAVGAGTALRDRAQVLAFLETARPRAEEPA